jgi:hypothetical protein
MIHLSVQHHSSKEMSMTLVDSPKVATLPELRETSELKPPTGAREPVKVNIYERMAKCNAQLVPIFPYDDAGSMVPCGALLYGGPDRPHGHFFHWNTVSEVLTSWGANGAMIPAGAIMATQPFHGVNSFLKDETDPESYVLATIIQRQSDEEGQREALSARCQRCKKEIVLHDYAAPPLGAPDHDPNQFGREDDVVSQFPTLWASSAFVSMRNDARVCAECGHDNGIFGTETWGWYRLVQQTTKVNAAYHSLKPAAEQG